MVAVTVTLTLTTKSDGDDEGDKGVAPGATPRLDRRPVTLPGGLPPLTGGAPLFLLSPPAAAFAALAKICAGAKKRPVQVKQIMQHRAHKESAE